MKALAMLVSLASLLGGDEVPARTGPPPNIVLITTDDQPARSFRPRFMPQTFKYLVRRGVRFEQAVDVSPLCCPSRATIVTGQYPHNTGVLSNNPGYRDLVDKHSTLPVWLGEAGYKTGHFGKWMHGYETLSGSTPAPGWDRWVTQAEPRRYYITSRRSFAAPPCASLIATSATGHRSTSSWTTTRRIAAARRGREGSAARVRPSQRTGSSGATRGRGLPSSLCGASTVRLASWCAASSGRGRSRTPPSSS